MSKEPHNDVARTLREQAARYVVGAKGQPIAVLLMLEEYDHTSICWRTRQTANAYQRTARGGDTISEALENVTDALLAIVEAYHDLGRPLPPVLRQVAFDQQAPFWIETAVLA